MRFEIREILGEGNVSMSEDYDDSPWLMERAAEIGVILENEWNSLM